jgi:hypothetical protein
MVTAPGMFRDAVARDNPNGTAGMVRAIEETTGYSDC